MPDPRPLVADASAVILLAKAGLSGLPASLFAEVLLPETVAQEIEAGLPDDPARLLLASG